MELQINASTKEAYQGKNQEELLNAKELNKFKANEWLTFLQAKQLGLIVKKGEHSTASVFKGFGSYSKKTKDGKIVEESAPLGFARLFNLDQTEKIKKD